MKWTLKIFALLSLIMMMTYAETVGQYPVYVWSKNVKGTKQEIKGEVDSNNIYKATKSSHVSGEIKNILDSTDANSLIMYYRPGMTTTSLINTITKNYKIASILRETTPRTIERSYTDVSGEPIEYELKQAYENVRTFTVDSQKALDSLKYEINNAPKPFIHQYYIIELPFEDDAIFDDVVYQIEKVFSARTLGNHVSILAGGHTTKRNLQETDVEPVDEDEVEIKDDENYPFLDSNILTKILLIIPLSLLLIVALLQMYYIKTPTLFVEKGIDFGKIEK